MVHIHLNPLDTIFFRDSRPFAAGDDGFAEGGLPSPLSIYGAIGSYYLDTKGISLADFKAKGDAKLGKFDDLLANDDGLRIKGPFLSKDGAPYFAPPANLWRLKSAPKPLKLLPSVAADGLTCDQCLDLQPLLPVGAYRHLEPFEGNITQKDILNYLKGFLPIRLETLSDSSFFETEQRTGHLIESKTCTVADGMLYTSRHLRFEDRMRRECRSQSSLLVIAEQLDTGDFSIPASCMGGERRSVRVTAEEPAEPLFPTMPEVFEQVRRDKKFLLYLTTPAIFTDGWRPKALTGAKLVGAAVGKPRFISGWQSLASKPRPLLKMVPAGGVFFYEVTDDSKITTICSDYHFNKSISDYYPNAGFGTTLLGVW